MLVNSFMIPGGITNGVGQEARACAFSCFRACNIIVCSSGVRSVPFFAPAISRASLNSGLSREHMCCHMFLPALVFPSGLGNTPVTKIGGHPSPMEERASMWAGVPKAVWSETLLPATMMPASSASVHQLVPTYWLCSGRSPHSWWLAGMPGPSSFSGSIGQKWVLNQNPRNHMGHPKWLAFFLLGHICLYAYMHKVNPNIFGYFFDFILVLLSFHCSHTVPIFSKFSLFFLPFYSLQKPVILTRHC